MRSIRFSRILTALAILLTLTPVAYAQIGAPPRPTLLAPSPYVQRGAMTGSVPFIADFRWRTAIGGLTNPPPQYFAICLHPAPPTGANSCDWITKRWSAVASGGGGLSRAPVLVPGTFVYSAYDYRFDPPTDLEDSAQDIPLVWTAASCVANAMSPGGFQCNAAPFQPAHFPASNLSVADPAYDRPNGSHLDIDVRATTQGSRAINASRFDVRVDVWEALTELVPPNNVVRCRTDYLAADIQGNPGAYAVIRTDGSVYQPNQLPAGTQQTDIAGIHFLGNWTGTRISSSTDPTQSIAADVVSPRGVYRAQITPMTNGSGFIVRQILDYSSRLVEFQETDNVRARCKAF